MRGRNQHYLPAALIGGFGRPWHQVGDAQVAVRRKPGGAVDSDFPAAETLAYRRGMYSLASPPAGVDPDSVDSLWDPVQTRLRDLVGRLNDRRLQPGDDEPSFTYAARPGCATPRSKT